MGLDYVDIFYYHRHDRETPLEESMSALAQAVRDLAQKAKANALGDEQARKGEGEVAADYYEIAGLKGEAQDIRKRTSAQQRQDEGKRQQQFKKDQDKLEKELGL